MQVDRPPGVNRVSLESVLAHSEVLARPVSDPFATLIQLWDAEEFVLKAWGSWVPSCTVVWGPHMVDVLSEARGFVGGRRGITRAAWRMRSFFCESRSPIPFALSVEHGLPRPGLRRTAEAHGELLTTEF